MWMQEGQRDTAWWMDDELNAVYGEQASECTDASCLLSHQSAEPTGQAGGQLSTCGSLYVQQLLLLLQCTMASSAAQRSCKGSGQILWLEHCHCWVLCTLTLQDSLRAGPAHSIIHVQPCISASEVQAGR